MAEPEDDDLPEEGEGNSPPPDSSGSHARARSEVDPDAERLKQAAEYAKLMGLGEPYIDEQGEVQHRVDPRSKYNEQVAEKILAMIRLGSFRKPACLAAGITPRTLNNWEREAKAGREPFVSFWERMAVAEAQAEVNTLGVIVAASRGQLPKIQEKDGEFDPEEEDDEKVPGKKRRRHKNAAVTSRYDWHAAAFILERRGPRRWAQRQSLELRGGSGLQDGPKIQVGIQLPEEEGDDGESDD